MDCPAPSAAAAHLFAALVATTLYAGAVLALYWMVPVHWLHCGLC